MPPWRAFVINLNNDHDRWSFVQQQLAAAEVPYTRISGVDGEALKFPLAEVSERSLKYLHGRYPSKPEVGCYLSHIKAIEAFLDSDLDYGLILEDDVALPNDLGGIVDAAIEFRDDWDILRLSSVNSGRKFRVADLGGGRFLGVCFTREKGAAAYLLNRKAARVFRSRLLPMRFAYDIAFDLYFVGLKALMVVPLPVLQGHGLHPVLPGHGFASRTQHAIPKRPPRRYFTVFPVRAALEVPRFFARMLTYVRLRLKYAFRPGAAERACTPRR